MIALTRTHVIDSPKWQRAITSRSKWERRASRGLLSTRMMDATSPRAHLWNIKRLESGWSSRKGLNGAHGSIQTEADFIIDKSDSSIQSLFRPPHPYQSSLFPVSPPSFRPFLVPNLHFLNLYFKKKKLYPLSSSYSSLSSSMLSLPVDGGKRERNKEKRWISGGGWREVGVGGLHVKS